MLKIATIGGGSSYTPELMEGFIKRYEEFPVTDIWLVMSRKEKKSRKLLVPWLSACGMLVPMMLPFI